jgi:hypothetical protein
MNFKDTKETGRITHWYWQLVERVRPDGQLFYILNKMNGGQTSGTIFLVKRELRNLKKFLKGIDVR